MDNYSVNPRKTLILLILIFVGIPVSFSVYMARPNAFAPIAASTAGANNTLTNPYVLSEWLPPSVVSTTRKQIDNYFLGRNVTGYDMTIKDDKITLTPDGAFKFSLQIANETHLVEVRVKNFEGTLSTAVYIDGQLQTYAPPQQANGTQFNGFEALTGAGLSSVQLSELQRSLQAFAKDAQNINVDTNNVEHSLHRQPNGVISQQIDFKLAIDGTQYQATVTYSGITDIHLYLHDNNGAQVFDSGNIDTITQP